MSGPLFTQQRPTSQRYPPANSGPGQLSSAPGPSQPSNSAGAGPVPVRPSTYPPGPGQPCGVASGSRGRYSGSNPSSRDLYPTFLSIGESAQLQLRWAWSGLWDAFRWNVVWKVVTIDPEIRTNFFKSFLLNTIALVSIYIFEVLIQPIVLNRGQEKWLHRNIGRFYHVVWLLPVLGVTFYLNSSWCALIARRTFMLHHGSRSSAEAAASPGYAGMLKQLATSAYRIVMVFTCLLVSFGLAIIPYVGPLCGFVFFCWIDAYYCFEFVWIARGMSLTKRVRHLEERWSYYLAFGLPSTAICMLGSGLASAVLFALVYPAYIILAMHASPRPLDPYNPSSSSTSPNSSILHPSPFIPIRIPVFGLVMWLNDGIVRVLSVGSGPRGSPDATGTTSPGRKTFGRARALSDTVESVEEGGGGGSMPMASMGQALKEMQSSRKQIKTRERVMIRRKVD